MAVTPLTSIHADSGIPAFRKMSVLIMPGLKDKKLITIHIANICVCAFACVW